MKLLDRTLKDKRAVTLWNKLDAMRRLDFVLEHQGLFVGADLVSPGEVLAAKVAPDTARRYIIENDESPFFSAIDIKKDVQGQEQYSRFAEALWLAFH